LVFELSPALPGSTAVSLVLLNGLALHHFGWFASGAWAYRFMRSRRPTDLALSAGLMPLNLYMTFTNFADNPDGLLLATLMYVLFVAALLSPRARHLLSVRPLLSLGFISYPLYLINENALVAFTVATHAWLPFIPARLTFVPGLLAIVVIAWLIAAFVEPPLKDAFITCMARLGGAVRRRRVAH
jgi:peptidoglycan/LPS O-acetylase OafA/YrhL